LRNRVFTAFIALTVAVLGLGLAPGSAAAETTSAIRPVRQCVELVRDFDIPGAATHVTAATVVAASAGEPEHCDVRGYVDPAVQFQLRLPTATFTGRYLQYGCGGFCGMISPTPFPDCGGPDGRDVAVAVTNDGHVKVVSAADGAWANDQAARNDWFYRAPHVLSLAAKRIIATYYGSPPEHSYFSSCSNGGREALLLAQRYPHDFEGIIAGAPANYLGPLLGVYETWLARTNTAANGAPIITSAKLPALHNAVVAACDGLDGLVDGQIDDPRDCRFDPVALQCLAGTDQPSCLTPAQVDAARKLYAGPTDAHGHRLYPGGQPRGSELAWDNHHWLVPPPEGGASTAELLADTYLKHVGYPPGTPHSSVADFEFTIGEFDRLRLEGAQANALNLDLEKFRQSGGKLIIWHGWSDQAIPPAGTLDYYQRLWQHSGGLPETQEWARVFMIPTMAHCFGGYRLTEFDPLPALVSWVERGTPPDRIIATARDPQGHVLRSRPVFPYPVQAKYTGTGSIDEASNFVPAAPLLAPHDTIRWVGTDLYTKLGPVAP
jgi:hypothetical protein